jgi:hypothetical protein
MESLEPWILLCVNPYESTENIGVQVSPRPYKAGRSLVKAC